MKRRLLMDDEIRKNQLESLAKRLESILIELDAHDAQVPAVNVDAAIISLYETCGLVRTREDVAKL